MKKIIIVSYNIMLLTHVSLSPFGSGSESSTNGGKASIIVSGNVETYEGNRYELKEITFNKLIHKIPVYEMPTAPGYTSEEQKKQNGEQAADSTVLKNNPLKEGNIFFKDLETIQSIETPHPDHMWTFYKDKKGNRKIEFVEIIITSNESANHYLVEKDKYIDAGEVKTPITNVKLLTITSIEPRVTKKEAAACPSCPQADKKQVTLKDGTKKKLKTALHSHKNHHKGKIEKAS